MKAAILYKQNSPLIVDEIEIPENLEYGQVLVKVYYSSICGSQIGEIKGIKGKDKYLPHLLGHEGSGKVIKIGPGVSFVKINDFVVMHWKKGLGIDSIPAKYKWPKKNITVNSGLVTTFSEYSIVSENRLTKINNNIDLKLAPLFGCAITTGFGIIKNDAVSSIGDSIVVIGCGGVGINTIIAANLSSNYPIIAVDIDNKKLNLAKKFGADIILNAKHRDFIYKLDKLKKKYSIDFCIETTGIVKNIELAYNLPHQMGKTVLVGVPFYKKKSRIDTLKLHFGKTIVGSHGGSTNPSKDIIKYMNLLNKKNINLKNLISKVYPLSKINNAIKDYSQSKLIGKPIIKM